jgi:hypothetical protein
MTYNNWREDPGLKSQVEYKRRFAILPVMCSDGISMWFKPYYSKYKHWGYGPPLYTDKLDNYNLHTDFIENITEAEYIIRKLTENL